VKTEHWLTIVAMIATSITTLAAPILAEFVKSRSSQPKPIPEPNQPKDMIHRIGGWVDSISSSSGLYLSLAVLNIFCLIWEIRTMTVPIKLLDVLEISVTMGAVYFNIVYMNIIGIFSLVRTMTDLLGKATEMFQVHAGLMTQMEATVRNLREDLDALKVPQAPKPAQLAKPIPSAEAVNPKPDKPTPEKAERVRSKKKPKR